MSTATKMLLLMSVAILYLASFVSAHYQFPVLLVDGVSTGSWTYVRKVDMWNNPGGSGIAVTDVQSLDLRCNNTHVNLPSGTATVAAGTRIGFQNNMVTYHHGVYNVYMARAPRNVSEWDGSGAVWFRVHEVPPVIEEGSPMIFPAQNTHDVQFTLPLSLPSGEYLVRVENIALHLATSFGKAEFYLSCGQIKVTDGGDGIPGPLVAIPGLYTGYEPGLILDVYDPAPKPYTMPGPTLWIG